MTAMAGGRTPIFWGGCAAVAAGVGLHLPMYVDSLAMAMPLSSMPMDPGMTVGMALIILGCAAAGYGALAPVQREGVPSDLRYEAPDTMRLGNAHRLLLLVMFIGLVIDTMKPATLGFVLPGLAREYGIPRSTAALLPLTALIGTTVGSFVWGWLADRHGRRVSILLSTILFIATSVCGTMPTFEWNLLMCFLMGASAGGMMPVVYTLLAEIVPPHSRSWVLVLVGGAGLIGGYFAASLAATLLEPRFGWRSLWLIGFPTGLLLLGLARFIPESPVFLAARGRTADLDDLRRRFGIVGRPAMANAAAIPASAPRNVSAALVVAALAWSLVNFGLLLWLPSDLQDRGYSAGTASGLIARSALLALPTIAIAAWAYSRWSSKWTLVAALGLTALALGAVALIGATAPSPLAIMLAVALLIIGSNAVIAVLLPYAAENYRAARRGRGTGLVAGSSKIGGVAALLTQMLHPAAVAGVWDHSSFRRDMDGRLRRTAEFIALTTYGSRAQAHEAAARVRRIHARVTGTLPDGTPYSADDPAVLTFVHIAGAMHFLAAWRRYGDPLMSSRDQDRYFAESAEVARMLGAERVPESLSAVRAYLAAIRPRLRASDRSRAVADALIGQTAASPALAPVRKLTIEAGIDLLPHWVRRMHGLPMPVAGKPFIRAGAGGMAAVLRWAMRAPAPQTA